MEPRHEQLEFFEKAGGVGRMLMLPLVKGESAGKNLGMLGKATLPAGSSLGDHAHHGEREIYWILSGRGTYHDDDQTYPVQAGDVTVCLSGHRHGLVNDSDEPLSWLAVIVRD